MRKLIGAICAATVLVLYATSCSTETMETSISITPSSLLLTVGETFNIIATVEPEGTKVSWTSSDV